MDYTIKVTRCQAWTIAAACELVARLGVGQWRSMLDHLPLDILDYEEYRKDVMDIGNTLSNHMTDGVDGWHRSLSIHNKTASDSSRIAWDIYQVIRHRLAWDRAVEDGIVESQSSPRNWHEMITVDYDEPHKVSSEPLAEIEHVA